ncbi:MAG: hypothetical protein WD826_08405 [Actinomycetota bacterium]
MSTDLAYLMAIRVQGFTHPDRVAVGAGVDIPAATSALDDYLSGGLIRETKLGFKMTEAGLERLEVLLTDENLKDSGDLLEAYERFLLVDPKVKILSSEWQEHNDESVIYRLIDIHARASNVLQRINVAAPRYAPYQTRLDGCVARLEAGDKDAFTKAATESYHQVWWELHTDLLHTLGLERED